MLFNGLNKLDAAKRGPLEPGSLIEDFELLDQFGQLRRLSEFLVRGPAVLFFYPAAMTKGCTAESCHFRDLGAAFKEAGAQRLGISRDYVKKQHKFSEKYGFDFPLLSDPEGKVAEVFGVKRKFTVTGVRRHTFVIGQDARLLKEIASEFNMSAHADRALEFLAAR